MQVGNELNALETTRAAITCARVSRGPFQKVSSFRSSVHTKYRKQNLHLGERKDHYYYWV
jgi:hypothetical protein